jgi:hypothetical protein
MKTILKLLVAAVLINGAVRAGFAAVNYYEFKEAAQQAVLFGAAEPTSDIRRLILERAKALNLPVAPDNVTVQRQGGRTWANASYSQAVELFPNQPYPISFSFSVEAYSMILAPKK